MIYPQILTGSAMMPLNDLLPSVKKIDNLDPDYFINREGVGFLLLVNEVTKVYYVAKTINARGYLLSINRLIRGSATNHGRLITNAFKNSDPNEWDFYFFSVQDYNSAGIEAIDGRMSDYQKIKRLPSRANNKEKTTWVYRLTHKVSARSFLLLAEKELDKEQAVGLFMRHWKQNNNDGLDRRVISLNTYFQCMRDFQEAAKAIENNDYDIFSYVVVHTLQKVTREVARKQTVNSNRVETIKYYQSAYNRSRTYVENMAYNSQE